MSDLDSEELKKANIRLQEDAVKRSHDFTEELRKQAAVLHEKRLFFTTSLSITILGLSVQTAKFQRHDWADLLEILGWTLLMVCTWAGIESIGQHMKSLGFLSRSRKVSASSHPSTKVALDYGIKYSSYKNGSIKLQTLHYVLLYSGIVLVAFARMLPAVSYLLKRI